MHPYRILLVSATSTADLVKVSRIILLDETFERKGIFPRVLEMLGAYVSSCETPVQDKGTSAIKRLRLEINVAEAKSKKLLKTFDNWKFEGPAFPGKFTLPGSEVYTYRQRCKLADKRVKAFFTERPELRDAPVDELNRRICLFNGKYSSETAGLKPGIPATFHFEPLTSVISKCPACGERLTFLGNDVPCLCITCYTKEVKEAKAENVHKRKRADSAVEEGGGAAAASSAE